MTDRGPTTWDAALNDSAGSAPAPRALLAGRYEIEGLLGVGGMGSVYRALDRELDERVALKVLQRALVADPVSLERFRREVRLARRVTHPNVARVYDIGDHEGERFLTMELVEGESLAATLAREVALPPARVVTIATAVCEGLTAAHAVGVIHRDLKPDNVILANSGRVVLTDFGIARLAGGAPRTQGVIVGTPEYMAPEQVDGRGEIDGRADLYALGVMMYEMSTGEAPWKGDSAIAIAARRLVAPPPDPATVADLPDAFAAVIRRCMARDRDERFGSARDVATALRACGALEGSAAVPIGLRPTLPPAPPVRTPRNARTIALLPIKNTGSQDDMYLVQTFGDGLCDLLSAVPGTSVRATAASAVAQPDVRARGRELGAEIVVTTSLRITAEGEARAAIRVVTVAEGLQLWAGRLDRPMGEFFTLIGDCVERIATALVLPPPHRAPAGSDDAAVVELLARAHADATSSLPGGNDRAVALLERAMAARESDYWVLSSYASALARRIEEGDGIVEEAREALDMARQALALVPGALEPHVARARLHLELGDPGAAALDLRFSPATGHALFQRTWGLLLADADCLDAAVAHLSRASRLREGRARLDEARVRALAGLPASAEVLVDAEVGSRAGDMVTAARVAMWHRDGMRIAALKEALRDRPVPRRDALLAYLGTTPSTLGQVHARLEEVGRAAGDLPRRRAEWFAMAAEAAAFCGDRERAISSLAMADASRLTDVAWLLRCPLLDAVRDHPAFAPIVASARARVAPALEARRIEETSSL